MLKKENVEWAKEMEIKNMEKAVKHYKMSQKATDGLNLMLKLSF